MVPTNESKDLALKVVRDPEIKMSQRVLSFGLYTFLRSCEVIDYWFPVKVSSSNPREIQDDPPVTGQ